MRRLTRWWRLFGAVAAVVGACCLLVTAVIATVEQNWPVAGMNIGLVAIATLFAVRRIDKWIAAVLSDPSLEPAPPSR